MAQRLLRSMLPLVLTAVFCPSVLAEPAKAPNGTATAADWPQWRGSSRDGLVPRGTPWPENLKSLQPVWRVSLGPSYSGPVVSQGLVFTTETQAEQREVVRALDRDTGRQVWEQSWEGALSVPFFAKANGDWIRSTPACADGQLFVGGMRDVLICLNARSGAPLWRKDFVQELGSPLPTFGCVCSPLVDGTSLYIQAGAGLCKVDRQTGQLVWRSLQDEGGMMGSAFSSPVLANIAGRRQLLVQTREKLAGVDPETGAELWSQTIPAFRGMNILTPTVQGDTVFTSAYGGKSFLFTIRRSGDQFEVQQTWTNKASGYMSSPVVIDGHLYLHLQNQRFTCLDLATGATKWTSQPYGKYWSLVARDDQLLALDERGDLLLIRANPAKFELLDSRTISEEPTWAHLALSGQMLFIRELHALAAYRWDASAKND